VELAGISADDLARFRNPPADPDAAAGTVPQPSLDTAKPAMGYPEEVLAIMATMSDDDIAAGMNYPDPPVPNP